VYAILPVSDKERDRTAIQDIVSLLPDLARLKLVEAASEEAYPAWSGAARGGIIEPHPNWAPLEKGMRR
jgi:hypothetical protein